MSVNFATSVARNITAADLPANTPEAERKTAFVELISREIDRVKQEAWDQAHEHFSAAAGCPVASLLERVALDLVASLHVAPGKRIEVAADWKVDPVSTQITECSLSVRLA